MFKRWLWKRKIKKKKKRKLDEFNKGERIRDLKIDMPVNLLILGLMLFIFNCVFGVCAGLLMYWIRITWVWIIDLLLIVFALIDTIISFFYYKRNYYFRIYENCLLLNSIWYSNAIIEYKNIKSINIKCGFWDKVFGRGTCTLKIFLNDESRNKITLYFLKEDIQQLSKELMSFISKKSEQKPSEM